MGKISYLKIIVPGLLLFATFLLGIMFQSYRYNSKNGLYVLPRPIGFYPTGRIDPMKKEIPDNLFLDAASGDRKSSQKLLENYTNCASFRKNSEGCLELSDYWSVIDAENGSSLGFSALMLTLSSSNKCIDIHRSLFWLQKLEASTRKNEWKSTRLSIERKLKSCS